MDEVGDVDIKHERPHHYGQPPPNPVHRMPPAETPTSYSYPPPPGAGMPPPAPAWNPTPSPYNDSADHRPPPQDIAHQSPYPPPPQQYPPTHPPPGREPPGYPPDPAYGRPGSVSGPTRSPADVQQPPPPPQQPPSYHPVSSNPHEATYYPPPADYRPRHAYPGSEPQLNGTHHQPLHVVTGHEMMPGQPPGPPAYGPPSAGPMPTPGPYAYQYPYHSEHRRKPVRAAQACDSCRQRKAKCDEGRPECQHCKDNGLKCSYREIPPQKSEKQVLAITAQLESLAEDVKGLASKGSERDDKMDRLLKQQKQQDDKINLLLDHLMKARSEPPTANTDVPMADQQSQVVVTTPAVPSPAVPSPANPSPANPSPAQPPPPLFRRQDSTSEVRSGSQSQNPSAASIQHLRNSETESIDTPMPAKHTTAAQNLVLWPSIKPLIPRGITPSYVLDEETSRGLLRLYGCGEGEDKGDGHEGAPSPAHSNSSEGRRTDDDTSSSSPHGVWGSGQLHVPMANQNHSAREHPGGLSPSGGLMLDSEAVDRYFRSFMDNMHIHHPFLEPKVLRIMIQSFKRKYSWDYRATQQVTAIGHKRKRETTDSPTSMDDYNSRPPQPRGYNTVVAPIEHSVANAIVLLVLALGKITSHRDPLPGPASTATMRTSTPHSALYSDLPMPMSAPTSPYNHHPNLNGTVSSPANPQGKNMDVIPGLAYFAIAADILGELPGGADVSHIQAYLLAGLYMGQLARILPSYFYINKACVAAQILIESTPYVTNTMKPARRNLVNFAFWSCLQLESDIAAELELPLSGIGRYESPQHKEFPTSITLERIPESSVDDDILRFYSYQIQLRTTMNSVHATLYRESKNLHTRPSDSIMSALDDNLENWRKMLNDWDWDDNDHESPNINVARMRGKYYGAKYIIWRPTLRFALTQAITNPNPTPTPKPARSRPSESPAGYGHHSEVTSPAVSNLNTPHPYGRDVPYIQPELLEGSRKCIEAAIRSTTSFDKVPRRLVVTNIFGTAHAQFGNMLVLYATFTSPHPGLSSLVQEDVLRRLHERTVQILRENEAISPVLAKDLKILEHMRMKVFPSSTYPSASTVSSFSSNR
ncbi:Fungal Zn2-Cys6 binuclear cluster domain-containing protein [Cladophialophora immunda]|nr:Fungal Zn2-Cys6 binuclear cluster domain-containing protein [Cladophialophora immunda]